MTEICFADILKLAANNFANQVALISKERKITYQELNLRVNSLARGLLDLGIRKGDRVASLLSACIESVEVHFATAKIGAVLVPLNPYLNPWEWQHLLHHCEIKLLIAEAAFFHDVMSMSKDFWQKRGLIWVGEPLNGQEYEAIIAGYPRLEVSVPITGKDLCTILYTSGTTGNPKGVIRTHENNFWATIQMALYCPYKPGDLVLFVYPMHGVRFFNIFAPAIFEGATIILQEGFIPELVLKTIQDCRVKHLFLVPTMWNILISHPEFTKYDLSSLQRIITGGAPMTIETKLRLSKAFPHAQFYEIWGTTEGGLIGLFPEDFHRKIGSVGRPLHFNQVKLVDEQGLPVPPGKTGEILVRGWTVASGYFKNASATEQNFDRQGWFHTNDLARADEEGYIYIVGRKSDTIIFASNKVYPQEVEEVLQQHPHVQEAVVFGIPDPLWGEIVAAAVVTRNGIKITKTELQEYVDQYLANYKKPRFIFFVDRLPKSSPGKISKEKIKKLCLDNRVEFLKNR